MAKIALAIGWMRLGEWTLGGPWIDDLDQFRGPFMFVTNGRAYVKQLVTKSGT